MIEDSEDPQGHIVDGYGWDDSGQRVPAVAGLWAHAEEPRQVGGAEVLDLVVRGVVFALESGHGDSTRTRLAALAYVLRLFPEIKNAADAIGVDPSAVSKAVKALCKSLSARPNIHSASSKQA